jgi:DNA-binding Lrp family transcriptional regulator
LRHSPCFASEHIAANLYATHPTCIDSHDGDSAQRCEAAIALIPEVVWCHGMSGVEDFMLMVVARDLDHFSTLLMEKLRKLPEVKSIRSSFELLQPWNDDLL